MEINENYQMTKGEGHYMCRHLVQERDKYKAALVQIEQRFKNKQALNEDDCFAYQIASEALANT